jgi:hypothetical protein
MMFIIEWWRLELLPGCTTGETLHLRGRGVQLLPWECELVGSRAKNAHTESANCE